MDKETEMAKKLVLAGKKKQGTASLSCALFNFFFFLFASFNVFEEEEITNHNV